MSIISVSPSALEPGDVITSRPFWGEVRDTQQLDGLVRVYYRDGQARSMPADESVAVRRLGGKVEVLLLGGPLNGRTVPVDANGELLVRGGPIPSSARSTYTYRGIEHDIPIEHEAQAS
jgi:hypothetical protein